MTDTYSQLKRTGKTASTKYAKTFAGIRRLPGRFIKELGVEVGGYREIMCKVEKFDEPWNEFDTDWRHVYCDDETEVAKVTMRADGIGDDDIDGWFTIRCRWSGEPDRLRGYIVERMGVGEDAIQSDESTSGPILDHGVMPEFEVITSVPF